MTREEAIENLKELLESNYVDSFSDDENKALEMAIQALSQEPTDDATLKDIFCMGCEFKEQEPSDTVSRGVFEQVMRERDIAIEQLHELGYELGQKIESCDDAVSRQAVKEIINDIRDCISVEGYCAIIERLKKLSSVNPQPSEHFIDGVHAMGYREGYKDAQKQKSGHWIHFAQSDDCSECGWSTGKIEYRGQKYTLTQLAEKSGIKKTTLKERLNLGWSIKDAVNRPVRQRTRGYRTSGAKMESEVRNG